MRQLHPSTLPSKHFFDFVILCVSSFFTWLLLCSKQQCMTRLPLPPGIPATGTHVEHEMILAIERAIDTHQRKEALWQLILFYHGQAKRNDLATALLQLMVREIDDPENTAVVYYVLGVIAQTEEKWQVALEQYENGLLQLPKQPHILYFLRKGAGYCLNNLERYAEGEKYCRWALEVCADRPDAFKDLGISLYA